MRHMGSGWMNSPTWRLPRRMAAARSKTCASSCCASAICRLSRTKAAM
ncbi:Uncharacterised protein [Bordetella pertussis]|nr:Uncharacterised protein [Bordetella pertussis]